jgi:hypothetical protein
MGAGHQVLAVGTARVHEVFEVKDNGAEQTRAKVLLWTARHAGSW